MCLLHFPAISHLRVQSLALNTIFAIALPPVLLWLLPAMHVCPFVATSVAKGCPNFAIEFAVCSPCFYPRYVFARRFCHRCCHYLCPPVIFFPSMLPCKLPPPLPLPLLLPSKLPWPLPSKLEENRYSLYQKGIQQQEKEASLKSGGGGPLFRGSRPLTAEKGDQQQEKEASLKSDCGGPLFVGSKPLTAQKEVQLQENETSDHANPGQRLPDPFLTTLGR